ncbi:hypothetical protein AB6D11_01040 [Vibrio splendidus]
MKLVYFFSDFNNTILGYIITMGMFILLLGLFAIAFVMPLQAKRRPESQTKAPTKARNGSWQQKSEEGDHEKL